VLNDFFMPCLCGSRFPATATYRVLTLSKIFLLKKTEIVEKAKEGFQELLYEKLEIFVSKPPLTHAGIHDILKDDPRWVQRSAQ